MLQTWGQTEEGITLIKNKTKQNKQWHDCFPFDLSDIWPELPAEQLLQNVTVIWSPTGMFDDKHTLGGAFWLVASVSLFSSHGNTGARSPPAAVCRQRWRRRGLQELRGNHSTLLWPPSCGFHLGDTDQRRQFQIKLSYTEFTTKICKRKEK